MKTRFASVRIDGGLDRVDRAVQLLEEEWRQHGDVQLASFWTEQNRSRAVESVDSLEWLAELVKADLRCRYDRGQTPSVSGYLEQFPELRGGHSRVLSLVYEEYCLREERGPAPDVESFCERYREWKSSLASQLRCHRLFSQATGVRPGLPQFPEPGENFEEFHLISLLGKGGTSRVFVARDLSLGGKQVALKVTLDRGQEPKVQEALDHPHIVPVNSVTYQTGGRLCGLSMPFQPGLPLDEIIKRVKPAERPGKAVALWNVLLEGTAARRGADAVPAGETIDQERDGQSGPQGDGWEGFPARGSYAQGVAWIGMIVARALQYAHGKLTYHRDVKPANMLLTIADGPQLLDFNLAESPHGADHAQAALHGGTLPYMAPEQIEAFFNPELWGKVGARADIYSLGLVLRELLTGQSPELPDEKLAPTRAMRDLLDRRPILDVSVRRFNPDLPHSLEAIVGTCLAHSPDDRYPDAGSLALDLERFLTHQPLLKAANPSRRERASNWVARHRLLFARAAGVIVVGVLATGVLVSGVALARAISEWRKHWVETLPSFQSAIRYLEEGEPGRAAVLLSEVEKQDPDSYLAKLYRGFALVADENTDYTAQQELRSALLVPDAERTLAAWAKDHHEVALHLVNFAGTTTLRADRLAHEYDVENPKLDEARDTALRRSAYELARDVLRLAEKLDPDTPNTQRLLATTEGFFGEYSTALDRLTRVIDSATSSTNVDMDTLFFCRKLRGRVAFLWIETLRKEGVRSDEVTLVRLEEARADLRWCTDYLRSYRFSPDQERKESDVLHDTVSQERKEYDVLHDRARAMLTLAEVEMELALPPTADESLERSAERHLTRAGELIQQLKEQSDRLKLRAPKPLNRRLHDDRVWLRDAHDIAGGRTPDRIPARTSGAGTHSS